MPRDPRITKFMAQRRYAHRAPGNRTFVPARDLEHWKVVAMSVPGYEVNADREFSAPILTEFYAARFCELNHLKM